MAETRERETRFSDRMSDHEALMWNVEKDPWLNPSGASLTLLQGSIDDEHFRRTMRRAVAKIPRLHERVVPGLGRLAPPAWVPDPEFDIDFHVRHVRLPKPGTERQLFDLAAQLYQEPLDRTRPLWRFVLIDGIEGGRSAIWAIVHHAVSDGIGQLRMAEMYQQLEPDAPMPDDVDLETIVADAVEAHHAKQFGGDLTDGFPTAVGQSLAHLVRRQLGVARRIAGEVVIWPADPQRAKDTDRRGGRDGVVDAGRAHRIGQRGRGRVAAVEGAVAAPSPRTRLGAARRVEGGGEACRGHDQRRVPRRHGRGLRCAITPTVTSRSMRSTPASCSARATTARSAATRSPRCRCRCRVPRCRSPTAWPTSTSGSPRSARPWSTAVAG